jgi:hypothetical protein
VETWEIKTNPSVGPSRHKVMPDEFASLRQPIRDHFSRLFHAALSGIDRQGSPEPIPVTFSAECLRGASPMVIPPRKEGAMVRIAQVLHPARPLFNAAARVISPLLARAARRFRAGAKPL